MSVGSQIWHTVKCPVPCFHCGRSWLKSSRIGRMWSLLKSTPRPMISTCQCRVPTHPSACFLLCTLRGYVLLTGSFIAIFSAVNHLNVFLLVYKLQSIEYFFCDFKVVVYTGKRNIKNLVSFMDKEMKKAKRDRVKVNCAAAFRSMKSEIFSVENEIFTPCYSRRMKTG